MPKKESTKRSAGQTLQPVHPSWVGEIANFEMEYERVAALAYDLREERPHPKTIGKVCQPRRCAICDKTEPEVTFRDEAHLIAASLGNRSLFSPEECDTCNHTKGETDDLELGKMLLPHRVIGRVRAREGTARLFGHGGEAFVGGGLFNGGLPIALDPNDKSILLDDKDNQASKLSLPAPAYRPSLALRSIQRAAWLAMDQPVRARHPWLRSVISGDRQPNELEYFEFVLLGMLDTVLLEVWERRSVSACATAPIVVRLVFVNTILVWCAPDPVSMAHGPSLLPPIGKKRPHAARFIRVLDPRAHESERQVTFTFTYRERSRGSGSLRTNSISPIRQQPAVALELSWPGGTARVNRAPLVKHNVDSNRPYFMVKGGSFAGWLSIQQPAQGHVSIRFEYQPHLVSPGDARATLRFLRGIGEPGRLTVTDLTKGRQLMVLEKGAVASTVPLPDIDNFLMDLETINRELRLDLRVPPPPCQWPAREVALLAGGIRKGRVGERLPHALKIGSPAYMARNIVAAVMRGSDLAADNEMPIEIMGTVIDAGRTRLVVVKPKLLVDPMELDAELAAKPAEELVEIELNCEMLVHEFVRWIARSGESLAPAPADK